MSHPLLATLPTDLRQKLEALSQERTVRAKKTVLRRGECSAHVYFLREGAVRVCHDGLLRHAPLGVNPRCAGNRPGGGLLLKLLCAPAMFGEIEALSGEPCSDSVVTVETSRMLVVPAQAFRFLLDHEPAFAAGVARDLAKRLSIAASNQGALAHDDVQARVARLLLDYAGCVGEPCSSGHKITAAISQASLAADLGLSRKSVGEVLHKLRAQGLLQKIDARYTLPNVDGLKALQPHASGLRHRSS